MKSITLDLTTLQFCTPEMLDRYRKEIPLMADYQPEEGVVPTNSQVYRVYIERYLCSLPVVNQDLDLIISQKEATMYGVPIQVYFFSRNKVWKEYERIQSDIFDHLLAMVPKFDLKGLSVFGLINCLVTEHGLRQCSAGAIPYSVIEKSFLLILFAQISVQELFYS